MAYFLQDFWFNHASQIAWRKSEFRIAKIVADIAAREIAIWFPNL